jgi:adenylate cyclase
MASSVAILFVDIVGSTGLYERFGNAVAKGLVTTALDLLREEVLRHSGQVVQAIGDELMCCFPNPEAACGAAISMQERISRQDIPAPLPVRIRIGLQWGEALCEGNNLYGDAVNTAARLAHIAHGGQIMTSESVIKQAHAYVSDRWREIGSLSLKGKAAPLKVCEILWNTQDVDGCIAATMAWQHTNIFRQLRLTFGDIELSLGTDRHSLSLGRDASNDLVIPYPEVSRHHATIACRMDKYYLEDHSTNGTTLVGPDQTSLILHREEAPLFGCGEIMCGFASQLNEGRASLRYLTLALTS